VCFDVLVVGGSIAGSTVALKLAEKGFKVGLFERGRAGETSVCAGGITSYHLKVYPETSKLGERFIRRTVFKYDGHEYRYDVFTGITVNRHRLDGYVLRKAVNAGVDLHEFECVRKVKDGMVYTAKGRYKAGYIVGADGVNSTVARCLGLRWDPRDLYLLSCFDLDVQWPEDEIIMRVIPRLDTYFWVFPKREVTNVGLGVRLPHAGRIDVNRVTEKFIREEVGEAKVVERRFAVLPLRARWRVVYGRVALVGDSAGMIKPDCGEGIFYARVMGEKLAEAIERGDLSGYEKAWLRFRGLWGMSRRVFQQMLKWRGIHLLFKRAITEEGIKGRRILRLVNSLYA